MPLPSFTLPGNLSDIPGSTTAGQLDQTAMANTTVTFTSNVPANQYVVWSGQQERVLPVIATVASDGSILRNGLPVQLLANDPGLSFSGLQWRVDVNFHSHRAPFAAPSGLLSMQPFWFTAPTNGTTLNLSTVTPVAGSSVSPVIRPTTMDDISDATAVGKAVVRAVSQAAARAAIGVYPAVLTGIFRVDNYGTVDYTGAAASDAARNAAITAMGTGPGILEFGAGTVRLDTTTTLAYPGQGARGQGLGLTVIDYRGTGDCFRVWDSTVDHSGNTNPGKAGPISGLTIFGWYNTNTNISGLHIGDLYCIDIKQVMIEGFQTAGAKGFWGENLYGWSERASAQVFVEWCTNAFILDRNASHPKPDTSWSYCWFDLDISCHENQNGIIFRNNCALVGVHVEAFGNFTPGASSNTGTALTIGTTSTDSTYYRGYLEFSCESDGAGVGHTDIKIGNTNLSFTPLDALGVLDFNEFTAAFVAGTTAGRLGRFRGRVHCPSVVDQFAFYSAGAGGVPNLGVEGSDANINIGLSPKGAAGVLVWADAGHSSSVQSWGADTNVDLALSCQGTGVVKANGSPVLTQAVTKISQIKDTNGNNAVKIGATASAVNELAVYNAATGGVVDVAAEGTDTNINIGLTPKTAAVLIWADAGHMSTLESWGADTDVDLNLVPQGAGKVKANGVQVRTITPRVSAVSNVTSWTINLDVTDYAENTGLTAPVILNNPTGTPANGQKLWVSITGTASRAISYGTAFEDSTVARPTTTSGTARLDIGFIYDAATSKLRCVAVA